MCGRCKVQRCDFRVDLNKCALRGVLEAGAGSLLADVSSTEYLLARKYGVG